LSKFGITVTLFAGDTNHKTKKKYLHSTVSCQCSHAVVFHLANWHNYLLIKVVWWLSVKLTRFCLVL